VQIDAHIYGVAHAPLLVPAYHESKVSGDPLYVEYATTRTAWGLDKYVYSGNWSGSSPSLSDWRHRGRFDLR
jgi:hypothetical protein